ncbi:helix-turn-helix domain-containing protein [Stenotrophomonas maltophilia]|uniref:Helix-turn-helix domain-containing protein n=1 Tax=Stenotrophomonas maltophilia TaxID=40324 RepID=A0A2J0UCK9_STEMA|nr:helix-turn-helix domain-containing protein [Stenotrophomonas muris]MBA0333164.1 helix-turn-helix domain-containing protein [Stenotrophomonas maltophilia]QCZ98549.1 helix-turn-helix domain-containing protein [Stenotrophomonas sp. pho]HBP02811.1 helix-turn-helix domain-containing protein [Stenotrophomonas sp.]MBH1652755.1 helix-turn-helix domain-containing protein [Stenotrophomonas maltophilia]MBH1836359.1 helix-turn-helix domain-containing protein [Stenotrophomonas maltophilia]
MVISTNALDPLLHRIPDACRRLSVSRTTLYELIKAGEIRSVKIGTRSLIPEVDLQRVLSSRLEAVR